MISRDRAGYYADAARQGAPQALQVADRFHLVKNMREKLQALLDRRRSCLPFVQEELSSAEHEGGQQGKNTPQQDYQMPVAHTTQEGPAGQQTAREQQRTRNREKRYALSESVKGLRRQGLSHDAIADSLGISRPTVRRFLAAEHFPERLSASLAQRASGTAPFSGRS